MWKLRFILHFIEISSLFIGITNAITPVCFNCHCSTYKLDTSISCKDAVFNRTHYFSLWTRNVTVVQGSDVVLAVEVKAHSDEYCWCTDAKLEWNGLYQNSSGRLLAVHIHNVSKTEGGHFWAVLYLSSSFYFSDSVFLNVTGPDAVQPLPPLELNPKMSVLIVGILFVLIMFFGIAIYCWQLTKRRHREKMMRKKHLQDLEAIEPLKWDLQHPANFIAEDETNQYNGVATLASDNSELEEEGSTGSSKKGKTSPSISSEDMNHERTNSSGVMETVEVEKSEPIVQAVHPVRKETRGNDSVSSSPMQRYPSIIPATFVPVTDDRFTTERSWYKSLNTEVVSESLLSNKEREAKKEEKRRRKLTNLAQGIVRSGDVGSGFMGSNTNLHREKMESYKHLAQNFRYGRSLPTPQPAGARPTVMTIFPQQAGLKYTRPGATIHSTTPGEHPHMRSIFREPEKLGHKRSRSVQFAEKSMTRRFKSADNLAMTSPRSGKRKPRKSNLKTTPKKSAKEEGDEVDGLDTSSKSQNSDNSSGSSGSEQGPSSSSPEQKPVRLEFTNKAAIPTVDVVPATPVVSCPVNKNRFTVKPVQASSESDPNLLERMALGSPVLSRAATPTSDGSTVVVNALLCSPTKAQAATTAAQAGTVV